ncbi:hypothetical protein GCM10025791_48550 [Halioxenophilus aromaticivorans]|uniref:protein-tyrosine-phosphatase n=2 Tax=Halioxenophilus aromaticivorans TaxID=1306992 RepID=A0AAV3UA57_9ALTE
MQITLQDIANSGLIAIPLEIRSLAKDSPHHGLLTGNGKITIGNQQFSTPDSAMAAVLTDPKGLVSSNGWQFWGFYCTQRQAWTPLEHLRAKLASLSDQSEIRTSSSHPLRVDTLEIPGCPGKLGLTFCPGKRSQGLYGGLWNRDLKQDLALLEAKGTAVLISLMETHEFALLGAEHLPAMMADSAMEWLHLPIEDMSTPSKDFDAKWLQNRPQIRKLLNQGKLIVIHCRGGLGRTGLFAARILVEAGLPPTEAVKQVRLARANAIETFGQEEYVLKRTWEAH